MASVYVIAYAVFFVVLAAYVIRARRSRRREIGQLESIPVMTEDDLLCYRLLRCQRCGNRDWIIGDTAPDCTICGTGNLWEEVQTFFARSQGPGLAPVPVSEVAA